MYQGAVLAELEPSYSKCCILLHLFAAIHMHGAYILFSEQRFMDMSFTWPLSLGLISRGIKI